MCTCKDCGVSSCLCECHGNRSKMLDVPKSREQKREELEDRYSNVLFDMDDEELDGEYEEKVGMI